MTPDLTGDAEVDLATLRSAFPHWRIVRSGGRWWAFRGPVVTEARTAADAVHAPTAGGLHLLLGGAPMTGLDVRGDDDILIVVDPESGDVLATAYAASDGWWRGRDVQGKVRMLFPTPGAPDPRLDIAERLTGA